jgi:PTH1 family peptidyl-tRNA hydrolase
VERLANAHNVRFSAETKFHGEVARVQLSGKELWLLKPDTFMNRSGLAVRSLLTFYKIAPQNLLVAHDEIDLLPGAIKLKSGGGHGGHNGLRDIIDQLGSKEFQRLRIGVGHPGNKDQVVDFVLHRAALDEQRMIDEAVADALGIAAQLASGAWEAAMQQLHTPR